MGPVTVDRNSDPVNDHARKGMGRVALIVLCIIAAIFIGYNLYYLVTPG